MDCGEGKAYLDDGLVADLRVGVAVFPQNLHSGHHCRDVHACGEGVEGDVFLHALGAHRLPDFLHPSVLAFQQGCCYIEQPSEACRGRMRKELLPMQSTVPIRRICTHIRMLWCWSRDFCQAVGKSSPDYKVQRYLVYLKYWTLNLTRLMVYPKLLFPSNFIH